MSQSEVQKKVHKIKVVNRPNGQRFQMGCTTEVFIDGVKLSGATFLKFEVKASSVAKVTIELLADVEFDAELPLELRPSSKVERNIEPVTVDGEVTGYVSPRWVLGGIFPKKIDKIPKK